MSSQKHQFEADTGRILDIVINALYSNREIFLRELISNASDALNKRRYLAATDSQIHADDRPAITLARDEETNKLTISDNGIGMSRDELVNALGTIARSGTKSFLEQVQSAKDGDDVSLIGQFGVGFYAAFMVADQVQVISRKAGEDEAYSWSSDGKTGYQIEPAAREAAGTDITLTLKADAAEFIEEQRIRHLVKKYSDHIAYPVYFAANEEEVLNSASALWTRDKADISEEDYTQFYQQVTGGFDTPYLTMHNRTEGMVDFINLLFVPSERPFDLFNPDRKSRIQLYINRVFITDECEDIIPAWLRFMRGIVDTADLDLNVSREMLQQNPAVDKIRKAIIRRVLSELAKAQKQDAEGYDAFWQNFGLVLKEGIYEDADNREKLLEISQFYSLKQGRFITLKTYLETMQDGQEEIYYMSAETLEQALISPHLEGYKARDLDVLLLSDPVDEFWLPLVNEYQEKALRSVSRGGVDLSAFKSKTEDESPSDEGQLDDLIARIKLKLGNEVADVRLSHSLTDSPSCLVADENGMDIQMERLMKAHDKNFVGAPRILEINPAHPLIAGMGSQLGALGDDTIDDLSGLLFDQAQILEGRMPADLPDFASRMNRVMQYALKADAQ